MGNATFATDDFKGHDVTIHQYDSGHWIALQKPAELIRDLEQWIVSRHLAPSHY